MILRTERLELRPVVIEDAADFFASHAADPLVSRFMTWAPHTSVTGVEKFLRQSLERMRSRTALTWAIRMHDDARPFGSIELRSTHGTGDVGFVIARSRWGRGIVPEALAAVIVYGCNERMIRRFTGACDIENVQSARVFEKSGFRCAGIQAASSVPPAFGKQPRATRHFVLDVVDDGVATAGSAELPG